MMATPFGGIAKGSYFATCTNPKWTCLVHTTLWILPFAEGDDSNPRSVSTYRVALSEPSELSPDCVSCGGSWFAPCAVSSSAIPHIFHRINLLSASPVNLFNLLLQPCMVPSLAS